MLVFKKVAGLWQLRLAPCPTCWSWILIMLGALEGFSGLEDPRRSSKILEDPCGVDINEWIETGWAVMSHKCHATRTYLNRKASAAHACSNIVYGAWHVGAFHFESRGRSISKHVCSCGLGHPTLCIGPHPNVQRVFATPLGRVSAF